MGRCQNICGKSSGIGTQKKGFSFSSLSSLHLVCLFWVVLIWFLLGWTFLLAGPPLQVLLCGQDYREWVLSRRLRQYSLVMCLSWGKERTEVNILQLDLWKGIWLPGSVWRELTGFFLDCAGGLTGEDPRSFLHHHACAFVNTSRYTLANGFVYNFVDRIIFACMWSQAYHQARWDEQCSLPFASHPLYISIKKCHWRGFCKVSHRVWAVQCVGQGMLRCLCAAQLFISYFCIYKRLIHEAPATHGKQLFGDSSILVFFFLVVFQALSLPCFFSCWLGGWGGST